MCAEKHLLRVIFGLSAKGTSSTQGVLNLLKLLKIDILDGEFILLKQTLWSQHSQLDIIYVRFSISLSLIVINNKLTLCVC